MRIAAAILAGGKATRMGGIAKGLLPAEGGITIVGHLIEELTAAGISDIVISANDPRPYQPFERSIIADRHQELGPLGGMEAALRHLVAWCDSAVFLPCDLPNLTRREILALVQAHEALPERIAVAGTQEGDQPLCAVVPVAALPEIEAAIAAGAFGVGRLWRSLGAVEVRVDDPTRLVNINTPEDLHGWRVSLGQAEEG